MKSILSLIMGSLLFFAFSQYCYGQSGKITITEFSGYPGDSTFFAPDSPLLGLRFTNNTGAPIHTISTGFKISSIPAGGTRRGDVGMFPYYYHTSSNFSDFFDLETSIFTGANNADVDTIGFYGRADSTDPLMGLSVGFDSGGVVVELGLTYYYNTERVCIDTCSLAPNRPWRWTNTASTPPTDFTPEFIGLPGQVYQNGEGPDRVGSGYCWRVLGVHQPPIISNCPPGTSIVATSCSSPSFQFTAQSPEGEPVIAIQIVSGPGTMTGFGNWTWTNISNADTGTYVLQVHACTAGGCGPYTALPITINPSPAVDITAGCNTDIMVTGESREIQMGTSNGACDDNVWSMTQIYGSPTGASCTLSSTGLISFEATDPGLYEYRVTVTDDLVRDSCNHFFIVHGGPGCCSGTRGNVDGVGSVDLSDLSRLIAYMHNSSTVLSCWDEANITGTGTIDLSDLSTLIAYLTVPGSITFPSCP